MISMELFGSNLRQTSSMPMLPDYSGVSQIQTESPSLPYGSPNLPDMKESAQSTFFTLILADFWHFGRQKIGDLPDFNFFRLSSFKPSLL